MRVKIIARHPREHIGQAPRLLRKIGSAFHAELARQFVSDACSVRKHLTLALFVLAGALPCAAATYQSFLASATRGTWQTLHIGGGGFVRGIDIECDQGFNQCNNSGTTTKIVRTDTYGAYVWSSSPSNCPTNVPTPGWQQLVCTASLPPDDPMNKPYACLEAPASSNCAVYEIRIAPSDTNVFYMFLGGYLYKTTNKGLNWTATGFARDAGSNANDGNAQFGPKIAIDPVNASNVIVCTETNGCFESTNGGMSFSAITGVTNATSVGMLAVFDPSSADGSKTPNFYIASNGTGVYKCTGGLSVSPSCTLSNSSGMPTTVGFMLCPADGTLYTLEANTGLSSNQVLHIYSGGAWSGQTIATNVDYVAAIAIDPAHQTYASNAYLTAINVRGRLAYSQNSGSAWSSYQNLTVAATDVPWLAYTNDSFMDVGQAVYDPGQSNVIYQSSGIGVFTGSPAKRGGITWNSQTVGIEQLVAYNIISPPGGAPVTGQADRPTFYISNPAVYPSHVGGVNPQANSLVAGFGLDYASDSPSFIAIVASENKANNEAGYSTNGGQMGPSSTWRAFATVPSGVPGTYEGGTIAAADPNVMVWALSDNGPLYETSDGGNTWAKASIPGIAGTGAQGWSRNAFVHTLTGCADRASSNTFYFYNSGSQAGSISTPGIYKGVYSGSSWTWTIARRGNVDPAGGFYQQLRCVPGNTGDMFFTSGAVTNVRHPYARAFYECTDKSGSVACGAVPNVKEVWAFGFGAAKPGGAGYPTIYIAGYVNNVWGVWRSIDHAVTWVNLGIPIGSLDQIVTITGDADTYGLLYVGFGGSGFAYGQFD